MEMKEKEGSGVDWEKRGVEVGKEAWAVLSQYMADIAVWKAEGGRLGQTG